MTETRIEDLPEERQVRPGFCYKNVGYGITSYERGYGLAESYVQDGKLFTPTFDSVGMEWDDRRRAWKFDGGLGMATYIVNEGDAGLAAYVAEYGSIDD